jgi:hypothetical protein
MDDVEQLIDLFAEHVGFKKLQLNKNGVIKIHFATSGDFFIERMPDNQLRLSLVKEHTNPTTKLYLRALDLVNYNQVHQHTQIYHAGITERDKFVFSTVLSKDQLILSEIMNSLEWLMQMHEILGS